MAEAILRGFLEGDDGEAKCEIMVASSEQLTVGKVGLMI